MPLWFRVHLLAAALVSSIAIPLSSSAQGGAAAPGSASQASARESTAPYRLRTLKEAVLLGTGGITSGIGTYLYRNTEDILLSDVRLREISRFDRVATRNSSEAAATASDVFFYGSTVLPFALLLDADIRQHAQQVGLMYAEVGLLTTGLTTLIKSTAQRPRPYLYAEGLPGTTVLNANDRAAFLSGHTSASAAGCFFAAQVYADFHPDEPGRWVVWGAAAAIPAVTGFLRVQAGRHYPTDVIAGYALGAVVGAGVPMLHQRARQVLPEGVSVTAFGKGIYASYVF